MHRSSAKRAIRTPLTPTGFLHTNSCMPSLRKCPPKVTQSLHFRFKSTKGSNSVFFDGPAGVLQKFPNRGGQARRFSGCLGLGWGDVSEQRRFGRGILVFVSRGSRFLGLGGSKTYEGAAWFRLSWHFADAIQLKSGGKLGQSGVSLQEKRGEAG